MRAANLRRGVAETATIVVGVLVALAADAAWDRRADALREAEVLVDLRREFATARDLLQVDLDQNRRNSEAVGALLAAASSDAQIAPDSATALVSGVGIATGNNFNPEMGALRALLASGELALISNDDLRTLVAGWPDLVEEALVSQRLVYDVAFGGLVPHIVAADLDFFDSGEPFRDREYLSYVAWINGLSESMWLPKGEKMVERIDTILGLIDEELAGRE